MKRRETIKGPLENEKHTQLPIEQGSHNRTSDILRPTKTGYTLPALATP